MTWGVMRPIVILPWEAQHWPFQRLRVVLLHELAHIKGWDYLHLLLTRIVCLIYWPNPLVWLAARQAGNDQETACDNRVLACGTTPFSYAEQLVDFVRQLRQRPRGQARLAVALSEELNTRDRIRSILNRQADRRPLTFTFGVLLVLLTGCIILPVACLNVQSPATAPDYGDTYIWLEAEEVSPPPSMKIRKDDDVSGGRYLFVRNDYNSLASPPENGRITYRFQITESGTYVVWGRVLTDDDEEDSFWMRVDNEPWIRWNDIILSEEWQWEEVHDSDRNDRNVTFELSAGRHVLELAYREEEIKLDKWLITNNLNYRPYGKNAVLPNKESTVIWLEAEQATLSDAVVVRTGPEASGSQYLEVARSYNSMNPPPEEDRITYRFQVDHPGTYWLWGRVFAANDGNDSFWVRVDGQYWVKWNGLEDDRGWRWKRVYDTDDDDRRIVSCYLDASDHALEVAYRENGARLDCLVLTDDPTYYPRVPGIDQSITYSNKDI